MVGLGTGTGTIRFEFITATTATGLPSSSTNQSSGSPWLRTPDHPPTPKQALKEAFVEFVNKDVGKYKNADLMSSFCDRILKKGGEKLSDEEVEDTLEKVGGSRGVEGA